MSLGIEPVAVPDVRGVAAEDAVNALLDVGLEPGERSDAFDNEVAAGCRRQHRLRRRHGGRARHHRRLRRLPRRRADADSEPPAPSRCPTSAACAAEDAVNQLIDAGLEPGERTDAFDNDVAEGAVIGTDPAAGIEVAPGTTVDYVVSLGIDDRSPVPDVRGFAAEDAVNAAPGRRSRAR